MIDLDFVERLVRVLDESGLDSLEIERGGTRIRLSRSPSPSPPASNQGAQNPPAEPSFGNPGTVLAESEPGGQPRPSTEAGLPEESKGNLLEVTSPMVGTFYRAPAPEAAPYVDVGQRVASGSVLCIIEAMKLMNELESEVEGTIVKVLVEDAQPVEYGQVLFLVDPS